MRLSEKIYGQEAAEKIFIDAFNSKNLSHAWLLTGERGIGKATFAYAAAALLLSDAGDIKETKAKIANKIHPDLFILESGEDSNVIKVDAARALAEFASLTAALGSRKIIIIDSVDDLNDNAANSLLKLLEEPQDATFFFLVCHSPTSILPTIRSRCCQLRFSPLSLQDFTKVIMAEHGVTQDIAQEVYELAKGSLYYGGLLLKEGAFDNYRLTEDLVLSETPDFRTMQKLMSAIGDDENWKVIKFAFQSVLQKAMVDAAVNHSLTEKQMDIFSRRLQLIEQIDTFHLDRSQFVAAILL